MKQINFDVRVFTLNPGGVNGGFTHEGMVAFVKENYPSKDGWEVKSVQNIQMSADGVSVLVFVAQYADEVSTAKVK